MAIGRLSFNADGEACESMVFLSAWHVAALESWVSPHIACEKGTLWYFGNRSE